ncbi:hypothetical protein DEJ47_03365 [Streptomyces venezuelae]|uniref:Uncharacterized protein n=1 Tax=Streptomyces venezuelae TaxID=54571 RepID=A0A5P2B8U2_STRVZ|nr:hypothetical protein DEJ47_03365 [Streptomyces venezuelae]
MPVTLDRGGRRGRPTGEVITRTPPGVGAARPEVAGPSAQDEQDDGHDRSHQAGRLRARDPLARRRDAEDGRDGGCSEARTTAMDGICCWAARRWRMRPSAAPAPISTARPDSLRG